ncbi:hypothetical protein CRYUN_Cryun06bG0140700 [Craigia yunnanensis]
MECRICQDEDEDSNMETPCSCCGSLKFAHRQCVQRWCKEKGNIICEICHVYLWHYVRLKLSDRKSSAFQQFKPGYTSPPPLFQIGRIPMNLSFDYKKLDMLPYSCNNSLNPISHTCMQFMLLLILRHTLPVILSGTNEYSFPLFIQLLLRTVGIILPIYVMVKAVTTLHCRRQQQETPNSLFTQSDEEIEHSIMQPQPHIVNIH